MKLSYRSFAAGEVSGRLGARVDQIKYQTGAQRMRNMACTLEGAVRNRSGFGFIRPSYEFIGNDAPRLLPFIFSDDQSYVIVLEHQRLSVISLETPQFDSSLAITGASQANPCQLDIVAHGLTTGDRVFISGVAGMTQLNNRFFRAVSTGLNTITLEDQDLAPVNSLAYGAYISGGISQRIHSIPAPWSASDLAKIRIAQSADVMFLAHPGYPLHTLTRTAGPTWTIAEADFAPQISGPTNLSGTGNPAGSDEVRYQVTAVSGDTLEESYPSADNPVAVSFAQDFALGVVKNITNITAANPPVVTSNGHGFVNGQFVSLSGILGMVELNGQHAQVSAAAANVFSLTRNGVNIDGTGFTPYASGGIARQAFRTVISTPTNHGMVTGDEIAFTGMDAPFLDLNAGYFSVGFLTLTTFSIVDRYGTVAASSVPVDATAVRTALILLSITFPSAVAPVNLNWSPVAGAIEYNIYRSINGIYAYVGTSGGTAFVDLGYSADPFDTPPIDREVFAEVGDFPATVGLFQQRLLAGGTDNDPERIQAGQTGRLFNFTKSNPIQADDSFSWVMRSNQVQGVRHIVEMSRCLVFTQSSVFTLEGNEAGALVPTAVNPRKRAEHGVGDVAPIPVGNAVIYVQANGRIVREILPGTGEDFNSKDLTVYSRHLFERNSIVAWSYAEEPSGAIWAVRDDGICLGATYQREHEVLGWHHHNTGDGDLFVDVCTIPEHGESITYAVIQRFGIGANPGTRFYIERLASRNVAHQADGRFLDCYRFSESENAIALQTYSLTWSGTQWTLTATGTTPPWIIGVASPDIGRVVLMYGSNGQRYWCTVQSIASGALAAVSVRTDVAGRFDDSTGAWQVAINANGTPGALFPDVLPYQTNDWSRSVAIVTDLWHLEGRTVRVVADGFPQGPFTVANGTIVLAVPAVEVVVGLVVVSELATLEADNQNGETWTGKVKTLSEIDVRVEDTDGLRVGTSWETLQAWAPDKRLERPLPAEGQPYSGAYRVNCGGARSLTGRVHLRQDLGLPTTILGVYPTIELAR